MQQTRNDATRNRGFLEKTVAGFQQKVSSIKSGVIENQRRFLLTIFSSLVFVALAATVAVRVTPRPSNLPSTPLNSAISFGSLNKTATLNATAFNEKNGVMQLRFTIFDGNEANQKFIDINNIAFSAITEKGGGNVTASAIPTSNNTVVVQFKNLSPKFNSITVSVADKNINTASIETPSSTSSSSSQQTIGKQSKGQDLGKFVINRDTITHSNTLSFDTQKTLELAEYNRKIKGQKQIISKNESAISEYEKAIKQQENTIKNYQKQLAESTDDDSQTNIDNAREEIKQIRIKIGDAQQNISKSKTNINDFKRIIKRVNAGQSMLPKPRDL
ncbi:MAG: hypothetical protein ACLT1L_03575 [Leuconostoc lactis]|uniref:hypothetical protein n=1 Tax=Leuconostoc lactis TaxID=1246 RepID=UPI003991D820